ncbi:hypothetical protein [Arthrobacter sp. UYCu712]|uniref:hypothetical protein n=1 Tax=Arthrobacter sp. UYCu712 TaxID=3156340 RepID=UPI0033942EE2
MGKTGGLVLVALLALTGCSAPAAADTAQTPPSQASTNRGEVQPITVSEDAKVRAFVKEIQESGTDYAKMPATDIAAMAPELCQHYDGGFTTEDLRKSAGGKLAEAGEAARLTVCPPR